MYKYPQFHSGAIYFKDGSRSKSRLNYNFYLGEVQFINPAGDTLSLANENKIKYITINADTFYYNKVYFQLLSGNEQVKLVESQRLTGVSKELLGGYGEKLAGSAVTPLISVNNGKIFTKLEIQKMFKLESKFFIGAKPETFVPINKQNLLKYFAHQQHKIKDYLQQNLIDFNKREDAVKVFSFLQTL
jgi:hypothetical protein